MPIKSAKSTLTGAWSSSQGTASGTAVEDDFVLMLAENFLCRSCDKSLEPFFRQRGPRHFTGGKYGIVRAKNQHRKNTTGMCTINCNVP